MDTVSLDDLFSDALATRKRKGEFSLKAADLTAVIRKGREVYRNPANWLRTRAVELIDQETGESKGVFGEYYHCSFSGCRRLIREAGVAEAREVVRGLGK